MASCAFVHVEGFVWAVACAPSASENARGATQMATRGLTIVAYCIRGEQRVVRFAARGVGPQRAHPLAAVLDAREHRAAHVRGIAEPACRVRRFDDAVVLHPGA